MLTPSSGLLFIEFVDFRAETFLLLSKLWSEFRAKVLRLENLANLNLALNVRAYIVGTGTSLDPLDRFFQCFYLPQPETGDQLLRLGERPVDYCRLPPRESDAHALRARVEPFARKHHAGLYQLFVVLPHFGKELRVRENARFGILVSFNDDHYSHCIISFCF